MPAVLIRGQGVIVIKLTPILILVAFVVSSCTGVKVSGSGEAGAPHSNPKAEVILASQKLIALPDVAVKIEANGETPFNQQVEFVAPDRYHVDYRDASGAETEMIVIGDQTYVRSGDSWNKLAGENSPTFRNSFTDEVLQSVSDVKYEGDETVGDKAAHVYSYKLTTKVGSFPVTQKLWVAQNSGLPVKTYVEYSSGGIKTLTTTYDTGMTGKIDVPTSVNN